MVIGIYDINKKNNLLEKREMAEIINKLKKLSEIQFLQFINPTEEYVEPLNKIYKYEYPIKCVIDRNLEKGIAIENIINSLKLPDSRQKVIIPNVMNSKYWVELEIFSYRELLFSFYKNGYFVNSTLIDTKNKFIFDIEAGEENYEIRLLEIL